MNNEMNGNGNGVAMVAVGAQSGVLTKQELGALTVVRQAETAALAIAAQAEAAVKARYAMALARQRDWDVVRQKILHECERPGLAAVAVYSKPQGKKKNDDTGQWEDNFIEGLSIRFAEVAMRCMGNLMPEITAIYDDDKIRIVRVALTDLESNLYLVKDVVIQKTVERKHLKKGQKPLESRINTYDEAVYILPATDDEVTNKENALCSKALRNHVLRILPGDLQDEARKLLDKTFADKDAKDPDAGRKEIADGFAQLNIMPDKIKAWLGHDLATADEAERKQLRKLYAAVKTGEMTWAAIMDQREEQRAEESKKEPVPAPAVAPTAPAKNLADLKAREKSEVDPEAAKLAAAEKHVAEQRAKTAQEVKQAPASPQIIEGEVIKKALSKPPRREPEPKSITVKTEAENGHMVNGDDTGPCAFEDEGVVCAREGYRYDVSGYVGHRCGEHAPPPVMK